MSQKRTVYIVGAGAIGKALAVFLKTKQRDVVLLRGSVKDVRAHEQEITVTLNEGPPQIQSVHVSTIEQADIAEAVIVITNKSFGNDDVARRLSKFSKTSNVVIMQNGLGVEQPFIDAGFSNVFRCVLFATSQSIDDNTVRFKPVSDSLIGTVKGDDARLNIILDTLTNSFFPFGKSNDIGRVAWKKTIANCVFNSICPLLETDNGIFYRDEKAQTLAIQIIDECTSVARLAGITISPEEVFESLLVISKRSEGQLISTLQDIRQGKQTEMETLNIAVANIAKQFSREDLTIQTKLLGELTLLKSRLAMK